MKNESEENNVVLNDEKISSNDGMKTIPAVVMLKSIEVIEDESSLKLIITSFEDEITKFMKEFEIKYYEDYNELRFSNYNNGLFSGELLVHNDNISDITGSKFIKNWYKTSSNIDHSAVYSILFRTHIKYTVEELVNPGRVIFTIQKSIDTSEELYILRSPSFNIREIWSHIEETANILDYVGLTLPFRILKDENGYFYPIKTFKSEKEAESFKNEMLETYEKQKSENNGYSANYGKCYNLMIEKRNEF